jgi:chromosome segregation ATPase
LALIVMAEGNETTGGEPGARRTEGDLLAERRARRAAESGEAALTLRAEAAEATVQTLERHVASLQQRLREAEEERRGLAELLEAEKVLALEREHELRRVKQREYAEQQLRVETEERLTGLDGESRVEIERLSARLGASEEDAYELARRLEDLQRQLAEAGQAAAAERAEVRGAEEQLRSRLGELERRAAEMQLGRERERVARERSERLLEGMRHGHRQMEGVIGEIKGILERLLAAAEAESPPAPVLVPEARGVEMADALAIAVERLRARAQAAPVIEERSQERPHARPVHKHSMSLIKRWRIRRKQRRGR